MDTQEINIYDKILSSKQNTIRISNHLPSARSQAKVKQNVKNGNVRIGHLVYVKSVGNKNTARDKYIVSEINTDYLFAKRLVGSQFRNKSYKLKFSEIYPVPIKCDPAIISHDVPHFTVFIFRRTGKHPMS